MAIEFAERIVGGGSKLTFVVKDEDGVTPTDPDGFVVSVYQPDQTLLHAYEYGTDVELERTDVGTFTLIIALEERGIYSAHAVSDNPDGANIFKIRVRGV